MGAYTSGVQGGLKDEEIGQRCTQTEQRIVQTLKEACYAEELASLKLSSSPLSRAA